MPLDDESINQAFERYRREYDCYLKLARYIADKCEKDIVRANTIRAAVTYRAKGPDKFREKLIRKYKDDPDWNSVDDAFSKMTDLAGVRISTYQEQDREKVVTEISWLFGGPGPDEAVDDEKKDQQEGFYRATHCQVALTKEDLEEPNENLTGLTCEIQVCSMLAHVWNEIGHDLVYKPTTGDLSLRENESLDILGNLTLSGDVVIKQLFDANTERLVKQANEQTPFHDVFDFVARVRDRFPDATHFGSNAGQLFDDLVALGLNTPAAIIEHLLQDGYDARASQLTDKFGQYLDDQPDTSFQIEPATSDKLLMLLLDKRLDDVVNQHPLGRGRGRPPRIASIAVRFRDMRAADLAQEQPAQD